MKRVTTEVRRPKSDGDSGPGDRGPGWLSWVRLYWEDWGWRRVGVGALIGLLSAAVAIGVGEAITAFVRPAASPIIVVGNRIILLTPEPVRRWAIHRFGTNDKPALLTGVYIGIAIFAVVVGLLALHRLWLGLTGLAVFGAIGVYCALTTNAHRTSDIVPTLFGLAAALGAMILLIRAVDGVEAPPVPSTRGRANQARLLQARRKGLIADRRQFLQVSATAGAVAGVAGFGGWAAVTKRYDVAKVRAAVALPAPASPAPALANGTDLGKSPVPWATPVADFYRIDTALSVPQINPATWSLRIHGMVDNPITLTYADLLARPLIERWITLTCVSRTVTGAENSLIGNQRFLGAALADILREANVHPGADQLVSRSSDGMSIGTPTAVVMDGRDAMLAVGMDGAPLPIEHGFPVRMVVPGLYGYVSACKWIVEIEATTFKSIQGYWVEQGWVQQAPIIVSSRIDAPKSSTRLTVGEPVAIAGVAWEQHVGVSKVEVQIDGGPWLEARLAAVPSIDTWQQWVYSWTPTATGVHVIKARATDKNGQVQIAANADPYPGAATGYDSINLSVR